MLLSKLRLEIFFKDRVLVGGSGQKWLGLKYHELSRLVLCVAFQGYVGDQFAIVMPSFNNFTSS